jgi:ribonuclease Y
MDLSVSLGVVVLILAVLALAAAGVGARVLITRAQDAVRRQMAEAQQDAESKAREIVVASQEKILTLEEEAIRRGQDLDAREAALENRAREIEAVEAGFERQRRELQRRQATLSRQEEASREALAAAETDRQKARADLERTAGLTSAQARAELVASIEEDARKEAAKIARRIEDEARERAERDASLLVLQAAERIDLRQTVESTVTFVQLSTDEIKGRIIGREGRNIRSLEMATGIDVIVDDTPRAILISSFDPLRREIARIAIDRLIEDGRIHPARIEEVVAKVRAEIEQIIEEQGAQSAFNLGVSDLHPRLARQVGRMKYWTHRGHNLLQHCTEVALIAGHMAAEIGARVDIVRRAGVLHEIGRVEEGSAGHTVLASAEIAAKYGEPPAVVQAIQSLHPDAEPGSPEAMLLRVANRLSDNRPGAHKDNLEVFVERLRRLETIACSFPGVTQAYAVKAGKEIRVILDAGRASDEDAYVLSKNISRAIEKDLSYTGQIKVSVIRETRVIHFAV